MALVPADTRMLETSHGPARVHLHPSPEPLGALVLGHGAAGGVGARDLVRVAEAALGERFSVALVEQPYRVAGRRSPAPAGQLDRAWTEVVRALCDGELRGLPLIAGGRSSGARVACRTAGETGAAAVLCLAFPLLAPRRAHGGERASRESELDAVAVPTLVVQGENDPFGVPAPAAGRSVVVVKGNHSLTSDLEAVAAAVSCWLAEVRSSSGEAPRVGAAPRRQTKQPTAKERSRLRR